VKRSKTTTKTVFRCKLLPWGNTCECTNILDLACSSAALAHGGIITARLAYSRVEVPYIFLPC